jgi:hypothetical protein
MHLPRHVGQPIRDLVLLAPNVPEVDRYLDRFPDLKYFLYVRVQVTHGRTGTPITKIDDQL